MSKSRTLIEQICYSLGKNNDASYAVVAVATAKGIFRPMFTMMDKHQDHETKKYTAMREGLTECIAIPCYLGVAWAAKNIAAPLICKKVPKNTQKAAKTLSFLGVCLAALIIIPAACSAVITPIMDFLKDHPPKDLLHLKHKKKYNNTEIKHLDINIRPEAPKFNLQEDPTRPIQTNTLQKTYQTFNTIKYDSPLRIGGAQ